MSNSSRLNNSHNGSTTHSDHSLERAILGTWCVLTFFFAFPGSVLTLYGSLRCKVIRINRVSRVLINNIAVADLGFSIFVILPVMMAIFFNDWIFGDFHCKVTQVLEEVLAFADFNMIFALSLSKLALLMYPLESKTWSRARAYGIVIAMWSIAILIGLQCEVFISIGMQNMSSFNKSNGMFMCTLEPDESHSLVYTLEAVEFSLLTLVPVVAVIISSVFLLFLANKHQKIKKEAILAVLLISGVYCFCALPIGLLFVLDLEHITIMKQIAYYAPFLNSAANFPIYCLSLRTVRQFARSKIGWISSSLSREKELTRIRMRTLGPIRTSSNATPSNLLDPTVKYTATSV